MTTRAIALALICVITANLPLASPVFAQDRPKPTKKSRYEAEEAEIPKTPTAPPKLEQHAPYTSFKCERSFMWKGKLYTCDSHVRTDAEGLRPIIQDVPEAVAELDTYQQNRRRVRTLAYVGTAGLILALGGFIVSRQFTNPDGNISGTGHSIQNISLLGGLGLAGGSLVYGLSILRTNEAHLAHAVESYNKANPKTPIELQFSTGISF